ncbi:hypothetical protein BKG76_01130 [Mycobacteroides franklinii]|uniref:ESX-1 secretion-associated protein n=1 Tax=Mycobacteroides franklinii TaxID=948102 RepID=A0A1S1LEA8_9MYCO|nr:hypothetical protein [Mycobacteroides franklinii]OHU30407.1 hypothetical protein BKG76_01130 [Mycobacteroides franklinii]
MSLENLKQNASNGKLVLHLDHNAINDVIAACGTYYRALENLKQDAEDLSGYPLGFAEGHLSSGAQLAKAFQQKAAGTATSAAATFKSHMAEIEDMKSLFLAIRDSYQSAEANNANNFGPYDR